MKQTIGLENNHKLLVPDKDLVLPGELGATIEWLVTDTKSGEIKKHVGPMRSESYVEQFIRLLWIWWGSLLETITDFQVTDTSGVERTVGMTFEGWSAIALANDALFGIVVGTGNTAPDITDSALETKIAHGVGAGQLQYGMVTFAAPASDATTSQFTITRNFANGSGGNITVNEIGLYVKFPVYYTPNLLYFMTIRDVVAGGIVVLNGQTLTVNYRPQTVI